MKNTKIITVSLAAALAIGAITANGVLVSADAEKGRYIEEGGNMQTLKNILGHSSLAMTADLYSHVLPDTKQQEMKQIENAFTGVAVL
jgi:integrase